MSVSPFRKRSFNTLAEGTATESTKTSSGEIITNHPYGLRSWEHTYSGTNTNWAAYQQLKRSRYASNPVNAGILKSLSYMDLGGEFENVKRTCSWDRKFVSLRYSDTFMDWRYSGPLFAKYQIVSGITGAAFPQVPTDLAASMVAKGSTAIARTIPTNPTADAAVFLGELRERLPAIPGSALIGQKRSSAIADEYLNVEFGLKPLINDLQKFAEAVQTSNKRIAQLERDSGRLVRRRYHFPEETSRVVTTTESVPVPSLRSGPTGAYGGDTTGKGLLTTVRHTTRRDWFSGAYTYHYAQHDDSVMGRMKDIEQKARLLYGVRLTPDTLWELAPWSWAADWVSNFGDVFHNISSFAKDGLVMRWGYMMTELIITDTHTLSGVSLRGGGGSPFTQSFTTHVKKRIKATPYGFGLDIGKFSTRQWAILAALGISRGRGQL